MPLAEAMGHGVPIVAYGVTAVPETVGGAGLVLPDKSAVPFAAAVGRVLARRDAARRPGGGGTAAGGRLRPRRVDAALRVPRAGGRRRRLSAGAGAQGPGRRRGQRGRRRGRPRVARSSAATRPARRRPATPRSPSSRQHPVDASGDRPRVGGVDEEAGVTHDLGQRATVVGDDRQTHRHGLDHRHAEALVLGGDDQHVGAGPWRPTSSASLTTPAERDGVVQAQLVDEAVERRACRTARRGARRLRAWPQGRSGRGPPAAP